MGQLLVGYTGVHTHTYSDGERVKYGGYHGHTGGKWSASGGGGV